MVANVCSSVILCMMVLSGAIRMQGLHEFACLYYTNTRMNTIISGQDSPNNCNLNLINTSDQKSSTAIAHCLAGGHDIIDQRILSNIASAVRANALRRLLLRSIADKPRCCGVLRLRCKKVVSRKRAHCRATGQATSRACVFPRRFKCRGCCGTGMIRSGVKSFATARALLPRSLPSGFARLSWLRYFNLCTASLRLPW